MQGHILNIDSIFFIQLTTLIKKRGKFCMDRVQSHKEEEIFHLWLNVGAFSHI